MSKKMMKRSLVLGALMAFVITGSAWASILKDGREYTGSMTYISPQANEIFDIVDEEFKNVNTTSHSLINPCGGTTNITNTKIGSHSFSSKNKDIIRMYGGTLNLKDVTFNYSGTKNFINNQKAYSSVNVNFEGVNSLIGSMSRVIYWGPGDLCFKEGSKTTIKSSTWGGKDITNRSGGRIIVEKGAVLTLENNGIDFDFNGNPDTGTVEIAGELNGNIKDNDVYINGGTLNGKITGSNTVMFEGGTWNVDKTVNTVGSAYFDATSTLKIDGATFANNDGKNTNYALNGSGTLTVEQGAKLKIEGIKETTYNIAQNFTNLKEAAGKWEVSDINTLMQGVAWTSEEGLQVEVFAKKAEDIAEDMGVSVNVANTMTDIITAANENKNIKPGTPQADVVEFANALADAAPEVAGQAVEAVVKMAEEVGQSAIAASIVKNVTDITNDRLSFNCGHSAPQKGGHGVGLLEEGSGADVWVEYVHGKDEVENMKSTAGATSYEGQYNGFVMGVDFKKVNKFQSGIAFNYGEGDTNSVGSLTRTHSDYDFWGVGYYGNIHNDDSNVIFDINYAKTDSDVIQKNLTGDIEASPEATTWTAGVKVEKLYQNENVRIVPYTGLRYMSIDADDYSTKCGTYNYEMERKDIWLLPVGVSIKQEVTNDNGWTVSPRVDLSYIWAFGDTDSNMGFGHALDNKITNIGYDVMDDGSFLGLVGIEAHKGQWGYGVAYSYQKGDHSESKKWYVDVNYSF